MPRGPHCFLRQAVLCSPLPCQLVRSFGPPNVHYALQVHLSHNRLTVEGAAAVLRALPVGPAPPARPLWLRMEWNRVSMEGLMQASRL